MSALKKILKKTLIYLLILEARIALRRHQPKIITVTGSIGKTSTKDAIFSVLSGSFAVRKSDKSFNTEVGVPLTILGLTNAWNSPLGWAKNLMKGLSVALLDKNYPTWLVLEVGADAPGDIASVAKWITPTIAVLTAVPDVPVHVEYFPSPEAVLKEKRALPDAVKKDGLVIIDGDCAHTKKISTTFAPRTVKTYGYDKSNDILISSAFVVYEKTKPVGMDFMITSGDAEVDASTRGVVGKQGGYPIAAAVAVGKFLNIPHETLSTRLRGHEAPKGRMRLLEGIHGSVVIDDTYNASPEAVNAALEALSSITCTGNRIAVIGDMAELGKYTQQAHVETGEYAVSRCDVLCTIGMRAKDMAAAAINAGMKEDAVFEYKHGEWQELIEKLESMITQHDIVLLKGSQFIRLEKVAIHLLKEPGRAKELLVRQDEEWQKR
ncbi:MAG: UDP-N-acetylmuramoyl-tripeptide--D-alanyl-D-alanine ligase [Minisyncoccia bacterium]